MNENEINLHKIEVTIIVDEFQKKCKFYSHLNIITRKL